MQVSIVTFPETRVACLSHRGAPENEHVTARQLVAWKIEHRLLDAQRHRSYGLHHADPRAAAPATYRVDFCLSIDAPVLSNAQGIMETHIAAQRCALARDVGHRLDNQAARWLWEHWLPSSGERWSGGPLIFHYVNVGPMVKAEEAITDVYLPLK
jgi:AraC family transcriptional regulator